MDVNGTVIDRSVWWRWMGAFAAAASAALLLGAPAGCAEEGPAEKTGEAIDEAAEDAAEAVEKAAD
jgi:hypothetical protein